MNHWTLAGNINNNCRAFATNGVNQRSHEIAQQNGDKSQNINLGWLETFRKISLESDDKSVNRNSRKSSSFRRSNTEPELNAAKIAPRLKSHVSDSTIAAKTVVDAESAVLHRPITIEEELYTRVGQIKCHVTHWRKRWEQQKKHSEFLAEQISATEAECSEIIGSIQQHYTDKIKQAKRELSREIIEKQKCEREKKSVELLYKLSVQNSQKESARLNEIICEKSRDLDNCKSLENEARVTISDLKRELSKVRRENDQLINQIEKYKGIIIKMEDRSQNNCDGNCEYRLLFDIAIARLGYLEKIVRKKKRRYVKKHEHSGFNLNVTDSRRTSRVSNVIDGLDLDVGLIDLSNYLEEDFTQLSIKPSLECNDENRIELNCISQEKNMENKDSERLRRSLSISSHDSAVVESCDTSTEIREECCKKSSTMVTNTQNLEIQLDQPENHVTKHTPLHKCMTSFSIRDNPERDAHAHTLLNRRTTWAPDDCRYREKSPSPTLPDSGNSSPTCGDFGARHYRLASHNQTTSGSTTLRQTKSISAFTGIYERRNGIVGLDQELVLHFKMADRVQTGAKKHKEIGTVLKKLSFSGHHNKNVFHKKKSTNNTD